MPELRDTALRAIGSSRSHVLFVPELHKRLVNHLYANYVASGLPDPLIGAEFWRCYRHLVEGEPVDSLPITLIDKAPILIQIHRILRGEEVLIDQSETPQEGTTDVKHDAHDLRKLHLQVVPPQAGRDGVRAARLRRI